MDDIKKIIAEALGPPDSDRYLAADQVLDALQQSGYRVINLFPEPDYEVAWDVGDPEHPRYK